MGEKGREKHLFLEPLTCIKCEWPFRYGGCYLIGLATYLAVGEAKCHLVIDFKKFPMTLENKLKLGNKLFRKNIFIEEKLKLKFF
jgi:hypothetical protein